MTRRALMQFLLRSLKSNTGSGDRLDLALGSVTCLCNFTLKMHNMEKLFDITRGLIFFFVRR